MRSVAAFVARKLAYPRRASLRGALQLLLFNSDVRLVFGARSFQKCRSYLAQDVAERQKLLITSSGKL